jgi:protein-disulfide isomerase
VKELAATSPPAFSIVSDRPDVTGAAIEGNANARVMVAEFSDFQCPFCKQWNDTVLRTLRTKLGDDVALAFINFPLVQIHPNAGNAAVVGLCAQEQGKFWQMHDLLFAKQNEWASLK